MFNTWSIERIFSGALKQFFPVLIGLLFGLLYAQVSCLPSRADGIQRPDGAENNVVSTTRDRRTRNQELLNNLTLKYGLVHNRSVNASLREISIRLGSYFDHPEFQLKVVILDREKVMAYLLDGQTLVLTRGMVYSGLLESTDQVAGVLAYLLAEKYFGHLALQERRLSVLPGESTEGYFEKNPVLEPVLYAALAMIQAGYHYQGIMDAVRLLGKARKDPVLLAMGRHLLEKKTKVLKGAGFFLEGQTAVLVHHNMTAIYDFSRFLSLFPLSIGGHFFLGLAYYQAFSETRPYSSHRFLFLDDPVPLLRTQETPLDIGALDAAESEWDIALQLNPAYSPALNGKGRILLLKGQQKEGRKYLRRAYNLIEDSPWYQADYAFALLMRRHTIRGSRLLLAALKKAGFDPKLSYNQAVWDLMDGHSAQSRTIFRKLLTLSGWRFLIRGTHPELPKSKGNSTSLGGEKLNADSFSLRPGETMSDVQGKIGFPKTPPVRLLGRTIWYYSGRGIRLIFHRQYLYYAIFEKKWRSKGLGGFYVGQKYSPSDPGSASPSWVVPYGKDPYLVFKKSNGYVAISEKNGYVLQVFVSIVPPNSSVNQDMLPVHSNQN
ncbi:MAG: tetratricopeptide repeat protein [Leptospirales bacterium]